MIETKSMLQITVPMLNQINVGYSSGKTHPTEKGELNGYEKIRFRAFSFSSSKDTRNKRFLPTQGTKITSSIDAGLQSENGFLKSEANLQYLHSFTKNPIMRRSTSSEKDNWRGKLGWRSFFIEKSQRTYV